MAGFDWLVGGFVLLSCICSIVVFVREDAEDRDEAVSACVGDGAADLSWVAGDVKRVFADCHLVGVVENDGFNGAECLSSVVGVVEGDFLCEGEFVSGEDWFDVFE